LLSKQEVGNQQVELSMSGVTMAVMRHLAMLVVNSLALGPINTPIWELLQVKAANNKRKTTI
jgi:hypothetical protein